MKNYTNVTIKNISNAKVLVPFSSTGTGTYDTVGNKVIGTGTKFMTEMPMGSWLVDLSANEFRYVSEVKNDLTATISAPFTADITGGVPEILNKAKADACEISVIFPLAQADGTANEWGKVITTESADIPTGVMVNLSKASREASSIRDVVKPCIVDATDTNAIVTIIY